jgi:hypothetical protein
MAVSFYIAVSLLGVAVFQCLAESLFLAVQYLYFWVQFLVMVVTLCVLHLYVCLYLYTWLRLNVWVNIFVGLYLYVWLYFDERMCFYLWLVLYVRLYLYL